MDAECILFEEFLAARFKKGYGFCLRRVEGKLFHKTTPLSTKTIFKIIGTGERDIKFIRGIS